jgi:dihydrofolate synthase/folylpolyglutamate synthase
MSSEYQDALNYLYSFTNYEQQSGYRYTPDRFDLDRVRRLLHLLGNPQQAYRAVHVAGTKGKGSTSAMIASILKHAGYRTGLYTSPHLHTFRERIQIDGDLISEQQVVAGVERLRSVAPHIPQITTFELITALALDYLSHAEAEWAVLEVGMGGRLDATNVITPQVSVITSISYDHTMYLGDTLAAIAAEKGGIVKQGVPVISAPQHTEADKVIERIAVEHDAPLVRVGQDWQWDSQHISHTGQRFAVWQQQRPDQRAEYEIPLLGQHQQVNAATALAAIHEIRQTGVGIPDQAVRTGLASVEWPGRLEVLGTKPWVIVDGAHNGDSMQKLGDALVELFPYDNLLLVLGASSDKDIGSMLDAILPKAGHILITQAAHPRAADAYVLLDQVETRDRQAEVVQLDHVLQRALDLAKENDMICATGSLFVVADFRTLWFKHTCQSLPPSDPQ